MIRDMANILIMVFVLILLGYSFFFFWVILVCHLIFVFLVMKFKKKKNSFFQNLILIVGMSCLYLTCFCIACYESYDHNLGKFNIAVTPIF